MPFGAKVSSRLIAGLKKFQPIVASAKARDLNESDTVVIVTDLLHEIFGYDKYSEITSEHSVRGTFCDLAVKLGGDICLLVEVKAIGLEPKDPFVKQAVDYAANQGCDWVALTTGAAWRVYRVNFGKPITHELVVEFNLLELNHRTEGDIELLGLLAKEGWQQARLGEYQAKKQALNRFTVAAVLLSDPLLETLRRELRRVTPDVRIDPDDLRRVMEQEVLKREVLQGDHADTARRHVSKAAKRLLRSPGKETGPEPQAGADN